MPVLHGLVCQVYDRLGCNEKYIACCPQNPLATANGNQQAARCLGCTCGVRKAVGGVSYILTKIRMYASSRSTLLR